MSSKSGKDGYLVSPQRLQGIGLAVEHIGAGMTGYRQWSIQVIGLNIKSPRAAGDEFLAVVKGLDAEGTACVAFHSAYSLGELLQGLYGRLRNGTLKWRIDEYMK